MDSQGRSARLSQLQDVERLDRSLLKEQAAERLHTYISRGRIPEGTRLTEREVSQVLGVSRMSAHEALSILESQGLVENRSDGRYVLELTEERIRDLHAVRTLLEKLAVELAAANTNEENREALRAKLEKLEEAFAGNDHVHIAECDLDIHRTIWHQANNSYLLKALESMSGVMVVLAARTRLYYYNPPPATDYLYSEHRELLDLIAAGDGEGAARFQEDQLAAAQKLALESFRVRMNDGDTSGPALT